MGGSNYRGERLIPANFGTRHALGAIGENERA